MHAHMHAIESTRGRALVPHMQVAALACILPYNSEAVRQPGAIQGWTCTVLGEICHACMRSGMHTALGARHALAKKQASMLSPYEEKNTQRGKGCMPMILPSRRQEWPSLSCQARQVRQAHSSARAPARQGSWLSPTRQADMASTHAGS